MVEEQFIIVHEGCGGTNGKRIWSFKEFNIHRDRVHKLPGVEGQRRGRAPSGHATREHPPPEKAQQYYEKRNTDKDRMKQRRRRKWQCLCLEAFLEEGKRNVEELSEERRKKLQKDYQAYLAADQRKAEQNEGIWWGMIIGVGLQTLVLIIIASRTNWNKEMLHTVLNILRMMRDP